jgi:hypothetical protein
MASLADVFVQVLPDMGKFEGEFRKRINKIDAAAHGKDTGSKFADGFKRSVKTMALGAVAGLAAGFSVSTFRGFIDGAREGQRVAQITENTIKTMGNAANVTAKQVSDLATAISRKAGVDDEAVQAGENLLLTFGNIRNAAGKNNDIFNQATKAAVDMAAGLNNGEVSSATMKRTSIALGKALNDPIKGITALSRSGVSFTAQQKEQIKTLVESGDTMGAQKVILKELGREFGGAARAASTPLSRLKETVQNLGEDLATKLLPYIDRFAAWVQQRVIPQVSALFGWMGRNKTVLLAVVGTVTALVAAYGIYTGTVLVVSKVTAAWNVVHKLLNGTMRLNPIGIVITAIVALIAIMVIAYKRSDTFRAIVDKAWRGIKDAASATWDFLKRVWGWLQPGLALLGRLFTLYGRIIGAEFKAMGNVIKWSWDHIIKPTWDALSKALSGVKTLFSNVASGIGTVWGRIEGYASKPVNFVIGTVYDKGIRGMWGKVRSIFSGLPDLPYVATIGGSSSSSSGSRGGSGSRGVQAFARGGKFNRATAIVGEGNPNYPEYVIPTDPKYRGNAMALLEDLFPRMASGGILGTLKDIGGWFAHPVDHLKSLMSGPLSALHSLEGSGFGKAAAAIPRTIVSHLADLVKHAIGSIGGGALGGMGWQRMMDVLHTAFPGLALISGYRPGAITATGNRSYHASGRAVDLPPSVAVFNWIRSNFGSTTKELIFSPMGNLQIWNGKPHMYSGITRDMHWNHVHWAYDNGGYLPPGFSMAYNGTGKPERVMGPNDAINVRVFIGDQELRGIVRTEVDSGIGRTVRAAANRRADI